jgi:hypothetical protein
MTSTLTTTWTKVAKGSAIGAVLFGGLLAGATANRAFVEMPAWERIGVMQWASYARLETGAAAFLLYPAIGGAALLLTIVTAIAVQFDRTVRATRRFPVYSAVAIAVVAAVITRAEVVPALSALRAQLSDPTMAQGLFKTLAGWWAVNDALHTLAFGFNLWALVEILTPSRGGTSRETLSA